MSLLVDADFCFGGNYSKSEKTQSQREAELLEYIGVSFGLLQKQ
jgi:hypothetical protein